MTTLRRADRNRSDRARLEAWQREARELATCSDCYGVGEEAHQPGRACWTCAGQGRAAREPHVLALLDLLRQADARIQALEAQVWPTRSALTLVDCDDENDIPSATVEAMREAALQLAADRAARLRGDE